MFKTYHIEGYDQISETQSSVKEIARQLGYKSVALEEISILVSELANNIVKFPMEGKIVINTFSYDHKTGIDIVSIDHGKGIENIEIALRDGYSTSGSMGAGLGAVKRLSDEFDIYSQPQNPIYSETKPITVVFARKWLNKPSTVKNFESKIGYITRPLPGFDENGDAIYVSQSGNEIFAAVIDGIGHGYEASIASQLAWDYLNKNKNEQPETLLRDLHDALYHTRGVVIAIAKINKSEKKMIYSGIGNISASVYNSPVSVHPVTMNGTLGRIINHVKAYEYEWIPRSILTMYSDGISTKFDMAYYSQLQLQHPGLIAHVVFNGYSKEIDDASILIIQ